MGFDHWDAFLQTLQSRREAAGFSLSGETKSFADFVKDSPEPERIPLLLYAYDRYRTLSACCSDPRSDRFESSCHSILISAILASRIRPTETEAMEILRNSFHQCGHGLDVEPPLSLAEEAFRNQPYSQALYDAVAVYKETLRPMNSTTASNTKRKLNWVLWHDPRHVEKKCSARRIQLAIHAMDPQSATRWQWLLRNTASGLNAAPGKDWIKEGKKRLAPIGEEEFLRRIDEWFAFPDQATLSPAGSSMLRLLVWYGSLVDVNRSLPLLVRVANVTWTKPEPAQKVLSALAWLLRTYGGARFDAEVRTICKDWSTDSAEVKRLEQTFLPAQALAREQVEQQEAEQRKSEMEAKLEIRLSKISGIIDDMSARLGIPALSSLRSKNKAADREESEPISK